MARHECRAIYAFETVSVREGAVHRMESEQLGHGSDGSNGSNPVA